MRKFQSLDRTARTDQTDQTLATVHQNTITGITIFSGDRNIATSVSTCGADSQLVIWNFKASFFTFFIIIFLSFFAVY